jgi:DNA-binding HxlR family transcriptional regulator
MEEEAKDIIVLGAIRRGNKKFDKIQKATQIKSEELNSILEKLEERGFIVVEENKGWLGKKIELNVTERGSNELDQRLHEVKEKWNQMQALYQSGDKQKLQGFMDDNRSFFPMMMFFGIMDIMMFSMMFSMIGASMGDYVPAESMPEGADGGMDDGGMDDGGFDIDIGF